MEINRNQYFMIGLVILLLGLQIRMVETYVLNERCSKFIAERLTPGVPDSEGSVRPFMPGSAQRHTARYGRQPGSAMHLSRSERC